MVFIKLKSDLGRYFGSETLNPVMIVMDGSIVLLKTMLLLLGYSEITPSKDWLFSHANDQMLYRGTYFFIISFGRILQNLYKLCNGIRTKPADSSSVPQPHHEKCKAVVPEVVRTLKYFYHKLVALKFNPPDLNIRLIKEDFKIGMHVFGLVQGISTLKDLEMILEAIQTVFCSPFLSQSVINGWSLLESR